ncbi:MAG: tRNA pseudouridine(55) synthase TruB [Oscillospiraceae bacterium]|nr:tRNA pseudouridine(55) synthase TruB [Oscillospiraceae bacterium]
MSDDTQNSPCGILLIDKPAGWTSHDVVAKLRGVLGIRRIGHAGTLDPLATGLLVVLVGKATRLMELIPGEKGYKASFRTGFVSDTLDIEGSLRPTGVPAPGLAEIQAVLPRLTGQIEQIPPMVSAVKVGGRRLYALARQGIEIERKPRPVTVSALSVKPRTDTRDEFDMSVTCSSGTYIRTIIDDLGRHLGCGAVMTALRRVRSGPYGVKEARLPEGVALALSDGVSAEELLLPIRGALPEVNTLTLQSGEIQALYQGKTIHAEGADGLRWLSDGEKVFALGRVMGASVKLHINFLR